MSRNSALTEEGLKYLRFPGCSEDAGLFLDLLLLSTGITETGLDCCLSVLTGLISVSVSWGVESGPRNPKDFEAVNFIQN